jgi:hypothetical protein
VANLQEEDFSKEIAQNEGIANLLASDSDGSNTDGALQGIQDKNIVLYKS